ncbi:MAG: phosphatidylglycerophosphatase A family protein [Candidatus Kryptoniota bacterium]
MAEQNPSEKLSFFDELVATGLGAGLSPIAPGTAGSLLALIIYMIPGFEKIEIIVPAIFIFFIGGSYTAGHLERVYGHDPSRVVIDEVVAMWISLLILPKKFCFIMAAFVIFRLLDIVKPFPANYFDRKKGGVNIMLDDVICGVYTNLVLQIIYRWIM